jgi:DHA1 family tetracycline resistance protein-like MFS transporter
MFALFAAEALGVDSRQRGWLLAYVGILVALVQGGGVAFLAKRFDERRLTATALVVAAVSFVGFAFAPSVPLLMIVLVPLSLSSGVTSTLLRSLLSKSVPPESSGGTMGLAASAESLNRVLAPLAGGALFAALGPWAPGLLAALLAAWSAVFAWKKLIREDCLVEGNPVCEDAA